MPSVSIVVPIYNVAGYLTRNLQSLKDQTFSDIEVLCVNDGSTDDSQAIIDTFCADDARFSSYVKKNGGLSDARNYGLERCRGEYVMFIDSDDYVEKTMVEEAYKRAVGDNLDLVIFDFYQNYIEDYHEEVVENRFCSDKVYTLKDYPELLCYVNNAAWNKLYKKNLFTDNHIIYPFGYRHQDLGTTPKLLYLAQRIGFVRTPLYHYLVDRPNNLTQQYDKKIYHIIDMNREYLNFYRSIGEFETYYEELKYLCTINCLTSLRKLVRYTDQDFVMTFIRDTFSFIHSYFPDYPKAQYQTWNDKSDKIYLNQTKLIWYWKYKNWKGKHV